MLDSPQHLRTVLETMQDALMIVDPNGVIVSVNRAMEELTGYTRDELTGRPCSVLDCDDCAGCFGTGEDGEAQACRLFTEGGVHRRRCELKKRDGTPLYVLKNTALLKDGRGRVLGGVETLTDVSDVVARDRVISNLRRTTGMDQGFFGLLGRSRPMLRLFDLISGAAASEAPVLIMGESGTGKELAAQALHLAGPRADGPLVTVNCAALNDALLESELFGHVKGAYTGADRHRTGRIEAAHGGDLFLDEIADMPRSTQVKLLRVLEQKTIERVGEHRPVSVDVRILTATNRDLRRLMEWGRFREDLYYRVSAVPIWLPPLRERTEDIPLLVDAFLTRIAGRSGRETPGISQTALDRLRAHRWPGNVRELINALEYAFVVGRGARIEPEHLPLEALQPAGRGGESEPARGRGKRPRPDEILDALERTGGRKIEAARRLGISRVTLWKRIKEYDLDRP